MKRVFLVTGMIALIMQLLIVAGPSDPAAATSGPVDPGDRWGWGENDGGELGDGTTTDRTTPALIGTEQWTHLAGGQGHACGIRDSGRLYCWGENPFGQIGDGTSGGGLTRTSPTEVSGSHTDWTAIATAVSSTCGIRNGGRLYCWGNNASGILGDGTSTDRTTPTEVSGSHADWTHIATGNFHTCGIRDSGRLYCWGSNNTGLVGDGTTTSRTTPTEVSGSHTDWTHIAAGFVHTCGIRTSRMYCWGENGDGQIGDGTSGFGTFRDTPTEVSGSHADWTYLAAGGFHNCGIRNSGRLYCWGFNHRGQLGDGTTTNQTTPTEVSGSHTDWDLVSSSSYSAHTCGIRSGTGLYCWGDNNSGQLGDGTATDRSTPVAVLPSAQYVHVALIENSTLAITGLRTCDGEAVTIDMNSNGGSGVGTAGDDVILGTPGDDVIAAGGGDDLVCAGDGDDRVYGQAGDDTIYGEAGSDTIRGGADNDTLHGGDDADDVAGGTGDDHVYGDSGADTKVRGGTGDDHVYGGDGDDLLVTGNGGEDTVEGGDGDDIVNGGPRPDIVRGGPGDDVLKGNNGADTLEGGPGNDELRGGPSPDTLDGGFGTDICIGGTTGGGAPETDAVTSCETVAQVP